MANVKKIKLPSNITYNINDYRIPNLTASDVGKILKVNSTGDAFEITEEAVQSVNSQTGVVTLTAVNVGAIAAPSSASSGQFLKYNGTNWVADNVPGGASPSDTTPAESTETGSAGTSSAYSRGDHSHPKEVVIIEYDSLGSSPSDILTLISEGKSVFVHIVFPDIGDTYLPFSYYDSPSIFFSKVIEGSEYVVEYDNVEWDSSALPLTTDTKTSFYGTSSTGATTQAKTTTSITGYALRAGNIVAIKFSNANTYTSAKITLNVSSTGAKDVWYQGAVTSSTNTLTWNAGDALTFIYTGSAYLYIGRDSNVFIATYGTTTYAEIENAYNANIPIIVKDTTLDHTATGTTNIYQLLDKTLLGFRFSSIDNYLTVKFCSVNTSNTWSYRSRMGLYKVNDKTSNEADADPGAITLDADDVGALASDGIAGRSRRLQETDSRSVNNTPANLISDPGMGVFSDFKSTSVINTGETPTKGFYQVISFVPWVNDTGGLPVQLALANKAGTPLMYVRSASSTSAWGSWNKLATISDIESAIGAAISGSY